MKKYDFLYDPDNSEKVTMGRKKRRKWDVWPRLICFVFAVVIWIYMVNINDTEIIQTKVLTIEIVGEEVMQTNSAMALYGVDKKVINVTVKGSNRDLKKYTEQDYKATVDISGLDAPGDHTLPINVIPPEKSNIEVVSFEPSTVVVHVDNRIEKEVPLRVDLNKASTYDNIEYTCVQSKKTVIIKGPVNIVDKISYASFEIEGTLMSSQKFSGFPLCFYDDNRHEIFASDYEYIDYSTKDITVDLSAIMRMSIPIKVKVTSESDLVPVLDKEYVDVYGDGLVMMKLVDPTYVITLDYAEDINYTLNDADLPAGVHVDGENQNVKIKFEKLSAQQDVAD